MAVWNGWPDTSDEIRYTHFAFCITIVIIIKILIENPAVNLIVMSIITSMIIIIVILIFDSHDYRYYHDYNYYYYCKNYI